MTQKGIQHVKVPPDVHDGRVERVHLTILNTVRTILAETGLPLKFWAEAANYAVYTRNRTPCGLEHKIPDDSWYNYQKGHKHLQPFGITCYYRHHMPQSKLLERYSEGILVGYVEGTQNYRIWNESTQKIVILRDVVFSNKLLTTAADAITPMVKETPVDVSITTVDPHTVKHVVPAIIEPVGHKNNHHQERSPQPQNFRRRSPRLLEQQQPQEDVSDTESDDPLLVQDEEPSMLLFHTPQPKLSKLTQAISSPNDSPLLPMALDTSPESYQ
jgi:hypothetical protein